MIDQVIEYGEMRELTWSEICMYRYYTGIDLCEIAKKNPHVKVELPVSLINDMYKYYPN